MLELNRNDTLLKFAIGNNNKKLNDEMNPKLLPKSYQFYSSPTDLLFSLLVNILV
jgi:hypothetical protein